MKELFDDYRKPAQTGCLILMGSREPGQAAAQVMGEPHTTLATLHRLEGAGHLLLESKDLIKQRNWGGFFFFHLRFIELWSKLLSLTVLGEALPDWPPKKFSHPWMLFSFKNTLKPNLPCWEASSQASQSSLAFGWVSTPWVINYPITLISSYTPLTTP